MVLEAMKFYLPISSPAAFLKILLSICVLLGVCLSRSEGVIKLPGNNTVPAVIVFGDSIVDTGNNNKLTTPARSNFPPYGREFKGGMPTGRFSNGKVPADFLVEDLGIKELLPAYNDPNLKPEHLLTGVNFASGGAGYDPLTSQVAMCYSLEDQFNQFKEYIGKVKGLIGEAGTSNLLALSLVLVVASSNDIATTYYDSRIRQAHYDIGTYTDIMVRSASDYVKELYGVGARRIGIFGAPPLGCIPSTRTVAGGIQRDCKDIYNQASQLFNSKLAAELNILNDLPGATVVYIDIYNPLNDIIINPGKYGFKIVNKGCCGTGLIEASVFCNQFSPHTCPDDSGYLFWDGFHPTEKAYRILSAEIIQNSINQFLCGDTPC